jgi:hypothetical protein
MNGNEMPVQNGSAIPANTPMLLMGGSDGTNSRYMTVDTSGRPVFVGAGTAGTPSGGIITIQGVSGGTVIPISINTPDTTATGSLGALNATVPITLAGTSGVAMQLVAGTLVGTIVPEISFDGGTTWVSTFFDDPSTGNKTSSIVFASNNTATTRVLATADGASNMRVRVSAYTSGTATCNLRGSSQNEPSVLYSGTAGGVLPPTIAQIGGTDGSNLRAMSTDTSGHPVIVGPGTAGTPSGGVITIQGVSGGTVVPVSGTVAVTQSTSPWVDNITQFGGTNISTGTGASGAGIPRVTVSNDSNILATQSGTWTVQPGNTANTTPWLITINQGGNSATVTASNALKVDGSAVTQPVSGTVTSNQGTANTLANAWPEKITDGTNGPVAVKPASTAAVATDPALVVAISPNNSFSISTQDVTNTGALGALNATVAVTHPGLQTVGMQLAAGTLIGTIVPEISFDGGTTWNQTFFDSPSTSNIVSSIVFASSNTATAESIVGAGGAGMTRVRVSAYTSGTANVTVRASDIHDPSLLFGGAAGSALPPVIAQMGGSVTTAAPAYTNATINALSLTTAGALRIDGSAVTQPVSGTVTANAGTGNFNNASVGATAATPPADATYMGGSVTTSAPTYTTGQMDPLSLTTAGLLRIDGVYPVNATTPTTDITFVGGAVTTAAPTYTTGQLSALSLNTSGGLRVDGSGVTQPVSGTVTANQGTANTLANAWPEKLTDGTNGPVAVKAASTAAVATDPALVVTIGPNTPLPAGTNIIGALSANQSVNLAQVAGATTATSASGVQKVGIVGNAGATLDATLVAGTAPTDGLGTLAQYNTTQPAPTNTQTLSLQSDQSGNLLTFPGVQTKTGAAWSSGTAINTLQYPTGTTTVGASLGAQALLVQLDQTTTLTGGAVTFQGTYDGTNWVTIPVAQVLNPQTFAQLTNPYTFVASTNQPFLIVLQGFQQIRANLTTVITGTGSVTPYWTAIATFNQDTYITDGTNGPVAVKPASTAPLATDPALVVVLSPNQAAIPVTTSPTNSTPNLAFGDLTTASTTVQAIRRTAYTEQSANFTGSIVSSSTSDTSAGTGARTVTIYWMNSAGTTTGSETATLNGTTAVNLVTTTKCFIEKIVVATVGSGGSNAGTITLYTGTGGTGTVVGTIGVGDNKTFWTHHYVVSGKTCYITDFMLGNNDAAGGGVGYIKATSIGTSAPEIQIGDSITCAAVSNAITRNYGSPIKMAGPSRITAYIVPNSTASYNYRGSFGSYDM